MAALRLGAQAVEEVVSPLPFTTGDVEDLVVTENTTEEELFYVRDENTRRAYGRQGLHLPKWMH